MQSPDTIPVISPTTESPETIPVIGSTTESLDTIPVMSPTMQSPEIIPVMSPTMKSPETIPVMSPTTQSPETIPVMSPTMQSPETIPVMSPTMKSPETIPVMSPTMQSPETIPVMSPTTQTPEANPVISPTTQTSEIIPVISPTTQTPEANAVISPTTQTSEAIPMISPTTQTSEAIPMISPTTQTPETIPVISPTTQTPEANPVISPTTQTSEAIPMNSSTTQTPETIPVISPTTQTPEAIPVISPTTQTSETIPVVNPTTQAPPEEECITIGVDDLDLLSKNEKGITHLAATRVSFFDKMGEYKATHFECLRYISAEVQLIKEIKEKYDHPVIIDDGDEDEDEPVTYTVLEIIANRIYGIYIYLLREFPIEIQHFKRFLTFLSNYREFISEYCNSNSLDIILSKKHDNPDLYVIAASFVFYTQSDIQAARRYFQYGISHYPNHEGLYLEDLSLEFQWIENTESNLVSIPLNKFKTYAKQFKINIQTLFILLDKVLTGTKANELQLHMINFMLETRRSNEKSWNKLAKIVYSGFIYDYDTKTLSHDLHFKRRLMFSFKAYEDGMRYTESETKLKLHSLYIDHIVDIWKSLSYINETIEEYFTKVMNQVFQQFHFKNILAREYYVYWAEFSTVNCEKHILDTAIERNNDNPDIWVIALDHYLKHLSFNTANRVLKDGAQALKQHSLPLWKMMKECVEKSKEKDRIEDFYKQAISCEYEEVRSEFFLPYLKWSHLHQGKSTTRKVFKVLKNCKPEKSELYMAMVNYEKSLSPVNNQFISKIYEDMCLKFSRTDIKLWITAIKFNYLLNQHGEADKMFNLASSILNPDLIKNLKIQYENIKQESRARIVPPSRPPFMIEEF